MNRIEGPAFACSFGKASPPSPCGFGGASEDEDQAEEDIGGIRGEDCRLFD
jgi:hypothetical protein